jgi:hypothetical protein
MTRHRAKKPMDLEVASKAFMQAFATRVPLENGLKIGF